MAGMEWTTLGVGCGVGLVIGILAAWLAVGLRARETQARLEAELAGERRIGAERVAMLEAGESRLREAFDALSRQALDLNNQSFLELARTKLGEFQQGARGDLDARQTAIGELLRPVRDSLERLDGSLRRVETTHGALSEKVARAAPVGAAPCRRDGDAVAGAADAGRAGPLGRGPAPARRRAGGHARSL